MKDETLSLILSEKNNRNTIIVATEINSGEQIIINEKNSRIIRRDIWTWNLMLSKNELKRNLRVYGWRYSKFSYIIERIFEIN